MTRTLTVMSFVPPTRLNVMRSSTRRSFTWIVRLISPTSSRNSVPPFANSRSPCFCWRASVKAPFSCPKSSDSSNSRGIAAQFTSSMGFSRRAESSWIQCAMSSFPVPLSPSMSTLVESLCATWSTIV